MRVIYESIAKARKVDKYTLLGPVAGTAIGIRTGFGAGNVAGKGIATIRGKFDKDLQASKKKIRAAETNLKRAQKLARTSPNDSEYGNAVSKAQAQLSDAKSSAAEHLRREAKRKKIYGRVGGAIGAGLGSGAGYISGKFSEALLRSMDSLNITDADAGEK